jgi:penicillin-binding protein 1A
MTAAYCTFVNDGYYTTPSLYTVVYDSEGRILLDNTPTVTVAMSQKPRDYMIQLLRYVVTNGTGKKAALGGIDVGGKTGTTTADNDRWFAGITPYYAGVVWFGYDKPQSLQKFSTNPALQLWYNVMSKVHEGLPDRAFQFKTQFVEVEYCMDSGEIPTDVCRMDLRGSRVAKAWVAVEDVPQTECSVHVALNIDTTNNCVANAACPSDKIKTIGALNLRRLYPYYGINITDQKYCAPYYVYQWGLDAKLYKPAPYTIQYCPAHDASTVVVPPPPVTDPTGDPGGSGGGEILPDPGGNGEPSDPGTGGTTEPGTGGSGDTGGGTSGPPASQTDLF